MKKYWTTNKAGETVWVTKDVAKELVASGKKKIGDFTIEDVVELTPEQRLEKNAPELAKMNEEIVRQQGDFNLSPAAIAPMSTAEGQLKGSSSWLSNAYDAASFLPRLAVAGYRELGALGGSKLAGALGGEDNYVPNVSAKMSGEDSNVFYDELGNPINYIPAIGGERLVALGAGEIAKKLPAKIGEIASKFPKTVAGLKGAVAGATEGAGSELISSKVEENATGKTDRSVLGAGITGGVLGGGIGAGLRGLKDVGESQILSEIKIPSRTEKGANKPVIANLLEYPAANLPKSMQPGLFNRGRNFVQRTLADETAGQTVNLTGEGVSDICDRISKITGGLVDDRADEIKKITEEGGYVNLNNVISKVKNDVMRSKKYDVAEKKIVLDELDNFRDTEIKTLQDMQEQGLYNDYSVVEVPDYEKLQLHPLIRSPFDYALDARSRAGSRAKFENINDPRREKPIADAYGDLYSEFNNAIFKPGVADEENVLRIGVNNNIPAENISGFKSTQEGLAKLVPFENILPARTVVANGRQVLGLPALIGSIPGAALGGLAGSVAGPAGTIGGATMGAAAGAAGATALTRGTNAGKLMYEAGKSKTLPRLVRPLATKVATEPFRTMYYRDKNGNLQEVQTTEQIPQYKDVASLPPIKK